MLVVTRKLNEGIVIDENIQVIVLGVEDGKVKLGIEAPREKRILRKEIYEAIKLENQEAIQIDKSIIHNLPRKNND
jgi:carbon storage regulator